MSAVALALKCARSTSKVATKDVLKVSVDVPKRFYHSKFAVTHTATAAAVVFFPTTKS